MHLFHITYNVIILQPLYTVSQQPQLRTGGFYWSSFTVHMLLLIAINVFRYGEYARDYSAHQWCYLHRLTTIIHINN